MTCWVPLLVLNTVSSLKMLPLVSCGVHGRASPLSLHGGISLLLDFDPTRGLGHPYGKS